MRRMKKKTKVEAATRSQDIDAAPFKEDEELVPAKKAKLTKEEKAAVRSMIFSAPDPVDCSSWSWRHS